jgi:tetratricopeptide (TPR) repeat protein/HAMP domain-containing protein
MIQLDWINNFNRNVRIRTKMIILICGVVLISIVPLSLIVLYRNQSVILSKTFEVCENLARNIADSATEELFEDKTYVNTITNIKKLKESKISGLLESYVIHENGVLTDNSDGRYVADLNEKLIGQNILDTDRKYFSKLEKLEMKEITNAQKKAILKFSYPIFIVDKNTKRRVGAAIFEFDKKKVYEPVVQIRTTIILVAAVIFIIGIIIALYTAIVFSKPILKLSEGARLIGSGDLNFRIKLTGKDEIGLLAQSFNQMTSQIQDFTHNLELKVAQRTDELNKTLQEVQALKIAQDGDYYLTSILLQPLQPNNNMSKHVKTDFLLEQKKKFVFKKWNSQIGGDICITDTIKLNGKEYTVFINGDAMGKSIQGAGGALVLGVVFNAGLIRSRVEKFQNTYPEIWLKERFLDLQNVFLSFEGSMYISVCLGLLDNESGTLFYINAEHPWTVLYRDGKASFLEEELTLRKIGTPEQEEHFSVRMFQLMPGDVLITGSDGRDDLMLKNADGTESVQEDENEFLKRVEEGGGDIHKIAKSIPIFGKIIDDFSLLRLSYFENFEQPENYKPIPYEVSSSVTEGLELLEKGNSVEAMKKVETFLKDYNDFPDMLKLLGKVYFKNGEYSKAIECFEQYLTINPGDNEYLYALSNTYRMHNKLNMAADVAERLYLRDTKNILNLINLATIYLGLKVFGRSEMMIKKVLNLDPVNKQAELLFETLKEASIAAKNEKLISTKISSDSAIKDNENLLQMAEDKYKSKDYNAALNFYAQLLDEENSDNSRILLKVANCYSNLNNFDQATVYYDRAINSDPLNYHAHNNIGGIFYKQGLYGKAKNSWIKTLEIKSDFKPAEINLTRLEKMGTK